MFGFRKTAQIRRLGMENASLKVGIEKLEISLKAAEHTRTNLAKQCDSLSKKISDLDVALMNSEAARSNLAMKVQTLTAIRTDLLSMCADAEIALAEISGRETEKANGTVRAMANIARDGLDRIKQARKKVIIWKE